MMRMSGGCSKFEDESSRDNFLMGIASNYLFQGERKKESVRKAGERKKEIRMR